MPKLHPLLALSTSLWWIMAASSQAGGPPSVSLEVIATGLEIPVAITHAGDERLFITLKTGQVLILENGSLRATPFLDIRDRVRSSGVEQGLTSIAFHPSFAENGFFFVHYTRDDGHTTVGRFRVSTDPNRADSDSERTLLTVVQPFGNHNGGQLQFGPDGYLYLGTGDGGSGFDPFCHGQREDSLLGKMLRLDVDQNVGSPPFYGIPPDNPFLGPGNPPDEVWATGLRNPWRFSFDRETGDLFIADVGQNDREEINFQASGLPGGQNYGWKILEGTLCLGDASGCSTSPPPCSSSLYTAPVLEYSHGAPDFHCSVTGGYVYRGSAIQALVGSYLYGDFCSGTLWAATRSGNGWTETPLTATLPGITAFGEAASGEIYLTGGDALLRLIDSGNGGEPGILELTASTYSATEGDGEVQITLRRRDGTDGNVSVTYATSSGTAEAGEDFIPSVGITSWSDGEGGEKTISVGLIDDTGVEGNETFSFSLSSAAGGAALGSPVTAQITLLDDDQLPQPCVNQDTSLCLREGRFRLEMTWRTRQGDTGPGHAVPLTGDTGYFWFFNPSNVEVVTKVLNGCSTSFESFWVFAGGLTNVETTLTVQDIQTGFTRTYVNPQGSPFQPLQDTQAFETCP
ncbi:MAG: PQQ-dependent sugar dehydrogenase [Deltaproteobacteria bacterium]|nr:PQQ-dependent sugar dehydrogenase [Deltaproteobacteria bacterium]